ncbi:hypothetical protein [Gordonia sp. (in: high G+C Gram-positive bacteria)]|uniref:hypothetical protein n=1 Tax=Gordonia sp. (in: high G+C Gram-positive bacteria) TaxID=84139 RepID=UPI003C751661
MSGQEVDCEVWAAKTHAEPTEPGNVPEPLDGLAEPVLPTPPTFPALPSLSDLPGIPVLPALPLPMVDPTLLLKPITDLLATFGTGQLGGSPTGDPAQAHQQIAQVLDSGVGTLLKAVQSVDGAWAGEGATSAIVAATRTATEAAAVAMQGTGMSVDLQAAAAIVAAGAAELQGIVVKTAGLLSATLPAIATPPGQIAALGIAAEGLAEGVAVVSATRAQLIAPTASMTANGAPVPVTGVPNASGDGFQAVAKVLESMLPLVQAGLSMVTSAVSGSGVGATQVGPSGDRPGIGAPAAVPAAPGSCPPSCESTAPTAGAPKTSPAAASTSTAVAGEVPAAVQAPAPPQTPLADRPMTSNATVATAQPASASALQVSGAGATAPVAPMAPMAARHSADAGRPAPVFTPSPSLAADSAASSAAEPGALTALTAESLNFDVALALGLGDHDYAGST